MDKFFADFKRTESKETPVLKEKPVSKEKLVSKDKPVSKDKMASKEKTGPETKSAAKEKTASKTHSNKENIQSSSSKEETAHSKKNQSELKTKDKTKSSEVKSNKKPQLKKTSEKLIQKTKSSEKPNQKPKSSKADSNHKDKHKESRKRSLQVSERSKLNKKSKPSPQPISGLEKAEQTCIDFQSLNAPFSFFQESNSTKLDSNTIGTMDSYSKTDEVEDEVRSEALSTDNSRFRHLSGQSDGLSNFQSLPENSPESFPDVRHRRQDPAPTPRPKQPTRVTIRIGKRKCDEETKDSRKKKKRDDIKVSHKVIFFFRGVYFFWVGGKI